MSGELEPGESLESRVVFRALGAKKAQVYAVCNVVGGPQYSLLLSGEAAASRYAIDRTMLDFKHQVGA